LSINTSTPVDGILISAACADAIHISGAATTTGLNVSADCVTGITIGAQTTAGITIGATATGVGIVAATTGVSISGAGTNALVITQTGSTATDGHCLKIGSDGTPITTATSAASAVKVFSDYSKADGYHVGAWFDSRYTADGGGSGTIYCLRGHADFEGTQTTLTTAQYLVGVHGRAIVSGTVDNSGLIVAGVAAQLLAGGTLTNVRQMCALWVDNQMATNPTAGNCDMIYISNNNQQGGVVDHIFNIYGANVQGGLFAFDTCMVGSNGFITDGSVAHAGDMVKIKLTVDGDAYYLLASTAPA